MHLNPFCSFLLLSTTASLALAAPATGVEGPSKTLERRQQSQCGQYSSISSGGFTLAANQWGANTAGTTGSQCSYITGVANGNSLQWYTTWTWANNPNQVKSYTNVVKPSVPLKAINSYRSIPTSIQWSYTGTNLRCNVAYDTFLGASVGGAQQFEVMLWLGVYGGVSPLSANGYPFTPIATPTISGIQWELAYGRNEAGVKVYSFVARSRAATSFTGDLLLFYNYLAANYASNGFNKNLVVQTIQSGTEVFTGSNAKLTVTGYTLSST
ncbi:MAG: hypothetical protein M1831_004698 [Alyxoria varia]|nr:MAG: hypothetical protein M1831_004698 [Alyxoria varia]